MRVFLLLTLGCIFVVGTAFKWPFAQPRITNQSRIKHIHFIRHGLGTHNVAGEGHCNDAALLDAPLVEEGRAQAQALGDDLSKAGIRADLYVSSPLRRALQTTELIRNSMLRDGMGTTKRVLVEEDAREHFTKCTENSRRSISEAYADFPDYNFSSIASNLDPFLPAGGGLAVYEEGGALEVRVSRFLHFLQSRHETEVIVVGHAEYIGCALGFAQRMGWERMRPRNLPDHVVAKPGGFIYNCQVVSYELHVASAE
jgi:broad specificity phosphatase PhoE